MNKQRQELHCHACNNYVQFDIDVEQNGNHVIICPNCGHEHCRVVRNGIIRPVAHVNFMWRIAKVHLAGPSCKRVKVGDYVCFPGDRGLNAANIDTYY